MLPVPNLDSYQKQLEDLRRSFQAQGLPTPAPHQIKYVDGMQGAKDYQSSLAPGESEIIMDKNEDIFYVASKDAKGDCPKLMTFGRFALEQEESPESMFVSKKDFAAFEQRIMALLQKGDNE